MIPYLRLENATCALLLAAAAFFVGRLLQYPGSGWQLLLIGALVVACVTVGLLVYLNRWQDERLLKIVVWSGASAFLTTIALLAGLAVLHDLGLLSLEAVSEGEALTGGLTIILATFAVSYVYYFNKGDIA